MPELPEVETYARQLKPQLLGHSFVDAHVTWPRMVVFPDVESLPIRLRGLKVRDVTRRGKYLKLELSSEAQLLIHLKMSGRLRIEPITISPEAHDRIRFGLDDGRELRFNDTRKFGRVYLLGPNDQDRSPLNQLGPEPLDETFTVEEFARRLSRRAGAMKPLLLDQSFIAGLGNIYADESLFQARIHPLRRADTLTEQEIESLHSAIRCVLQRSIDCLGVSFDFVYTGGLHDPGATYQCQLQVYQRQGLACSWCGQPIERMVIGGRGTHFCPVCQRR